MSSLAFSSPDIAARVAEWTSDRMELRFRAEVEALVAAGNAKELEDRFYRTLEFGTGGLRGVVGAGTNRMNRIVVAQATQGLANYVKAHAEKPGPLRAAIAHDSRHFSREFAETAAAVLAANGIIVHICAKIRPTPWLSFAVRRLGCHTGIVVTASHNPKEYNGYKVYWDDGSQVVPPHDKGIIDEVGKVVGMDQVREMDFQDGVAQGMIHLVGEEMDEAYLAAILEQRLQPAVTKGSPLRVVYTPLHGVGGTLAPRALSMWGFDHVYPEPEQMKPDGDFPTAASPNPEEGKALERAIALARQVDGDIVLATDPDADRLGIAVRHAGDYRLITGNQLSCVMGDYILRTRKHLDTLPARPGMVSTIVTTPLLQSIVESWGGVYAEGLTGFKWIAKQVRDWDAAKSGIEFLYGTEESYGYLIGHHAMDKDGIVAACLAAEIAAWLATRGKTIVDHLDDLYLAHGPRVEWQKSITMPGMDGAQKISEIMEKLRTSPPGAIQDVPVRFRTDYREKAVYSGKSRVGTLALPASNVISFRLQNGSTIVARPSGTEPKIKFYFFLVGEKQTDLAGVHAALQDMEAKKAKFEKAFLGAIGL